MNTFLLSQIFGILGLIANLIAPHFKTRRNILIIIIFSATLWTLSYYFIGALPAVYNCLVALVFAIISHFLIKKPQALRIITTIFILLQLLSITTVFDNYYNIFSTLGSVFFLIATAQTCPQRMRFFFFLNSFLWTIHGVLIFSPSAFISDTITTISSLVALYRFRKH